MDVCPVGTLVIPCLGLVVGYNDEAISSQMTVFGRSMSFVRNDYGLFTFIQAIS